MRKFNGNIPAQLQVNIKYSRNGTPLKGSKYPLGIIATLVGPECRVYGNWTMKRNNLIIYDVTRFKQYTQETFKLKKILH